MSAADLFQKPEPESPVLVHALSRIVSKRECAAYFNVSTNTIDRWLDAGMPVASRGPGGAITGLDLCSVTRWRLDRSSNESDLEIEKTRLTRAQANRAELEELELRGKLVRMEFITPHWQAMVAAARATLLALPTRATPLVVGLNSPSIVHQTLTDIVHEALHHLSGDAFPDEVRKRLGKYYPQDLTP